MVPPIGQPYIWPAPPQGSLPPPPPLRGTNGFATASLVFGLIGGVLFSVIFGIIALVQIRKQPQDGKGLAVVGLVASGVWTLVLASVVTWAVVTAADRDSSGEITDAGRVSVHELFVGDCINGVNGTEQDTTVYDLPVVPCNEPHEGEVYSIHELPESSWPGQRAVEDEADRYCSERFETYASDWANADSLHMTFVYPVLRSWQQGDRRVMCIAYHPTTKLTGSLRGN